MSVRLSVSLSVRTKQLGSHWTDFHEIWNLRILQKSLEKMQVSLKIWRDENNGYFTWKPMYIFLLYLAHFFLEWLHQRASKLRNTYIACLVSLCFQLLQTSILIYLTVMSTSGIVSSFLIIICHKMSGCDYGISLSCRFITGHCSLFQIRTRA